MHGAKVYRVLDHAKKPQGCEEKHQAVVTPTRMT